MLLNLYIKDYILIDTLSIDFHNGFSAFTGETGAGKSIFIDAIACLIGGKMTTSMIRQGCDKCIIEGNFEVSSAMAEKLQEAGYDSEEFIVTRTITSDGKSVTRLNQRSATLGFIKDCLKDYVDIHSQHENQYLMNDKYHLSLLDTYCRHDDLLSEVKQAYQNYLSVSKQYDELTSTTYNEAQLEILKYQIHEIDSLKIKDNEDEMIEKQLKEIQLHEKLAKTTETFRDLFTDDGILTKLYEYTKIADQLADFEDIKANVESITDAYYRINDDYETIIDFLDQDGYDISMIDELNERLYDLQRIKRKFGRTLEGVLQQRDQMQQQVDAAENKEEILSDLKRKMNRLYSEFEKKAKALSENRQLKAIQLEKEVLAHLKDLSLPKARFKIAFEEGKASNLGLDKVQFVVSMNPGQPLQPLTKVASGGELSRLMLGLKAIFTKLSDTQLVIFDEIDTGVSGAVAYAIGKKMQQIGTSTQVFSVTHLAPVAACGCYQYGISKSNNDVYTTTSIKELDRQQRVEQLALMSSSAVTNASVKAAEELLDKALA